MGAFLILQAPVAAAIGPAGVYGGFAARRHVQNEKNEPPSGGSFFCRHRGNSLPIAKQPPSGVRRICGNGAAAFSPAARPSNFNLRGARRAAAYFSEGTTRKFSTWYDGSARKVSFTLYCFSRLSKYS